MYELTYALQKVGSFKTFEEAFVALYRRLKKDLEGPGMSYQLLETAIWIESPKSMGPIMFYDARDSACRRGLLVNGELNKDHWAVKNESSETEHSVKGKCPECHSEDYRNVHPFDHVKECDSCGHSFLLGE